MVGKSQALLVSLILALGAFFLGHRFPLVGGPAFGLILGLACGHMGLKPKALSPTAFSRTSKLLLAASLSLLGFGLSLKQVASAGSQSLLIMFFTVTAAFATAFAAGARLKTPYRLTALIGMGTAICGGSAISALAPIIKAEENEIAYAVSTIFLYNLLAVLIFPPLGHWLGLSELGFGLWAGTAINDTSSVLAAGYSFGPTAGDWAAVVKLTRTTLIVPLCLAFAVITARKESGSVRPGAIVNTMPRFVVYFLAAAALTSAGLIPEAASRFLAGTAKLMIIWALAAVGLGTDFRRMAVNGLKPFGLGLLVWAVVTLTALLVQHLTGRW